jgi:hypothetical protein
MMEDARRHQELPMHVPTARADETTLLSHLVPEWHAGEVHELRVAGAPDDAWAAARAVTTGEVRILRPLMLLRMLPARVRGRRISIERDGPLIDVFLDNGFVLLGEREHELVLGAIGKFWRMAGNSPIEGISGADAFVAFDESGYAKAALNLRVLPDGGGARLVTETRVTCTSEDARRNFRRYWIAIRWGSGAIRRSWLAAIRRRALRAVRTAA